MRFSYFNLALIFIFVSVVLVAVTWTSDYIAALLSIFFLILGTVVFKNKGLKFFYLAYIVNLVSALVIANYYTATTGQPFTDIKDDVFFYNSSVDLAQAFIDGKWHEYESFTKYSGFGYILICAFFFYLISPFGVFDPVYIQVVNCFVGATISPAIYLIGKYLFDSFSERVAIRAATLVAVFPIFVYYSAIVVRDIWIASLGVWFIWVLLVKADEKRNFFNLILWPVVIVFFIGLFRPHSMVPLVFIWFLVVFLEKLSWRILFYKFVFLIASLFVIGALGISLVDQFNKEINTYEKIVAEQSTGGSLGKQILQSPTPVNEIARFIYTLYTPVPPIKDLELKSFYIGIGSIVWYFTIPFLYFGIMAGLAQKSVKKETITILIYLLITLFGIMLTSIDVRHKTMIFAISFLYAAAAFSFLKRKTVIKIGATYSFLIGLLAAAYVALKAY